MWKFILKNKIVLVALIISSGLVVAFWESPTATKQSETLPSEKSSDTIIAEPTSPAYEKPKTEPVKQVEESAPKPEAKAGESKTENTISVTVLAGEVTAHLAVAPDTLFYDALVQAKNTGEISFSGKNYTGLGFFVTDIESLHAGDGKDLLYYVNGKQASVGVSGYVLKDGDVLEWKLE